MNHLIIGTGVVGDATGFILEELGERVWYYDIDEKKVEYRKQATIYDTDFDVYWVCTAEWNVEDVIKELTGTMKIVVVRSTTPPGIVDSLGKEYAIQHIAHVPEFLRERYARQDALHPDRVVIGTEDALSFSILNDLFGKLKPIGQIPILLVSPRESEMIKLVSNAYLSTQISFWNEICWICRGIGIEPGVVTMGVGLDSRVSSYGRGRFGKFGGFCLPKDLKTLINIAKMKKCRTILLDSVKKVNDNEPT